MGRRKLTVPQPRLVKDARGVWYVTWTDVETGQTVRRSCSTRDRDEADARMSGIVAEAMNPAPTASYTIADLIKAYVRDRKQEDHSPTFEKTVYPALDYFGPMTPDQLKDATFRAYRKHRTSQPKKNAGARASKSKKVGTIADATAIRELNALRGAIGWGKRNGWKGLENVTVHIPNGDTNVRHRFLSQSEAKKLLEACIEPHTALFVRIAIATGARRSAVLELKWDDVTFPVTKRGEVPRDEWDLVPVNILDGPDLNYVDPETGEHFHRDGYDFDLELAGPITIDLGRGRGNKKRGLGIISPTNVGLYDGLVRAFKKRKSENVIEWRGKPVAKVDLTDAYRRAGITGATTHTLKHTCCSWLVQSGQSYEAIAKFIGTSARTIERHYGHLSPKHLATVGSVLSI